MASITQKRHLILIILIGLALVCYLQGYYLGSNILLGLGLVLEMTFWIRLLGNSGKKRKPEA